jgi:outer membrane lipoprotein SlyB
MMEARMTRSLILLSLIALPMAACTPAEQSLAVGTLGGAAVGAAVSSDDDRAKGAVVGAIVGATAATLLGPASQSGKCRYRDVDGTEFIADC